LGYGTGHIVKEASGETVFKFPSGDGVVFLSPLDDGFLAVSGAGRMWVSGKVMVVYLF
jgi:hypothetical protein